ncbi:prolyl oligopeptidase family serine peptidase [Leptolyngbya sp. CCNP1308]|uniref:alpha/beta hydrolase family protein n=1 Tax=Leptolyngbya sp. CCNP1308 TaxID=3110255 RepID=UPI002B1EAA3F|nr:prolyl oligopeptidase family serine peptidase [Leptolyngbya sp. CCNP1308]MEA5449575.1 prolyl oligopeptidase family serine peptidase [Leptolyngbya sp. CCNP1308]
MATTNVGATENGLKPPTEWQSPPQAVLDVLHAPQLPHVWTAPAGKYLLLTDPVRYPPLAELAAPMHKLAGIRINPVTNDHHGRHGGTSPRLVRVEDGTTIQLDLPADVEVLDVKWTADGDRYALTVRHSDHIGLWVGSVAGKVAEIEGLALNPVLGNPVSWLPDQHRLLIRRIPSRGPAPEPSAIPAGPEIVEGSGASSRSTYEARNLLETAHDDALFEYYATAELAIIDPATGQVNVIGAPAPYTVAKFSPSGEYLLVKYLVAPWSHEVGWWRFASAIEVWNSQGEPVATIASLPVADQVPTHGVPVGPRSVAWRPTAPHTLFWVEALDGGDPVAEVPHRDRLMRLNAPFTAEPEVIFKAEHRIQPQSNGWTAEGSTLMLTQRERIRRWRYVWLLDVDNGTSRLWFDLNEGDRYGDPGHPLFRTLPNGRKVLRQQGDAVYFSGSGATDEGDRPFLDLRHLVTGETERLFRSDPNRYEYVVAVAASDRVVLRSESAVEVPNYYLASFGQPIEAAAGEATRALTREPITQFEDPTPQLRAIEKRIVRYERSDGVPLSFHLYLPPGYQEGTPLPTVLYAYPMEYSGAAIAGQVRGSAQRFMQLYGASHLYFLLQGYAVLDQTAMPILGDPETAYDTFVPQLVADAEAAVAKAVEIGVADPERIGVIGHSHGGLMVANLLAHTDLFRAGIARSGSYNKTNQPFGFQAERRSLFEAREAYVQLSPTFFADQVNEPVLIIHGDDDSNPGTPPFQSQVFYEAVRGAGGTTRLVLLPFEDHGYRAKESIEHVLWEQFRWFDKYIVGQS